MLSTIEPLFQTLVIIGKGQLLRDSLQPALIDQLNAYWDFFYFILLSLGPRLNFFSLFRLLQPQGLGKVTKLRPSLTIGVMSSFKILKRSLQIIWTEDYDEADQKPNSVNIQTLSVQLQSNPNKQASSFKSSSKKNYLMEHKTAFICVVESSLT